MIDRPRLAPSPGDLIALMFEMARLVDEVDRQARRFMKFVVAGDDPAAPSVVFAASLTAIEDCRAKLLDRLSGVDYQAPRGWPEEVADALLLELISLQDPKASEVLGGMTLVDFGSRWSFTMPPLVAEAMAKRKDRALLIQKAIVALKKDGALTPSEPAELPTAPPVDFAWIVSALRDKNRERSARLVDHFKDKTEATFHALRTHVHDGYPGESAIKSNVKRTNAHLTAMGVPLRFSVRSQSKFVIRRIPAE